MSTLGIREKLQDYIRIADDKKVKAIYTMIENDLATYDWWKDEKLMAEFDKISSDFESGKQKGFTLNEMNERINKLKKQKMKN